MTIRHSLPSYDDTQSGPIVVETTVRVYKANWVTLSRIINSKLCIIELGGEDSNIEPITIQQVARLSKLDDATFEALAL